jgi:NAD(P)-dependent dehydrogenase (short-subunit alcohol dehydrogenase family)
VSQPVVLVTGATSGIGQAAARALARPGVTVVITARDPARGQSEVATLRALGANAEVIVGDFARLSDVRGVAAAFRERWDRLDVLVNNAGALFTTHGLTEDGYEQTLAVNHLAPFLLTSLLLDRLTVGGRVVTTSSVAHHRGRMRWDDLALHDAGPLYGAAAYSRSKLCNLWFTLELARRIPAARATANAIHPGYVGSAIGSNNPWMRPFLDLGRRFVARSVTDGAIGLLYAATSAELAGCTGLYLYDRSVIVPSARARDVAEARRCWSWSASAVGLPADTTRGAL